MTDLDKMARELLAAEHAAEGQMLIARYLRDTECLTDPDFGQKNLLRAVKAIRAALLTAPPGYVLVPAELQQIGQSIATQDNRHTADPIFIVQQKVEYAGDPDRTLNSRTIWVNDDGEEASPRQSRRLSLLMRERGYVSSKWSEVTIGHYWEFVTACFTEQGCIEYLERNGHNLKEPRIYAEGSYRNQEWEAVRGFLLAAAPEVK